MIKHKDIEKEEETDQETKQPNTRSEDFNKLRFRSMSVANKSQYNKMSHDPSLKRLDTKTKFDIFNKMFKNVRKNKKTIGDKIDKFADKKASHFVNLKKLKKKEPFSLDNFENEQARSLSRTFTGGIDMINKNSLLKMTKGTSLRDLASPGHLEKRASSTGVNFVSQPEKEDNIKEEDYDPINQSTSLIGDFYDTPVMNARSSICIKGLDSSRKSHQNSNNDKSIPLGQSNQLREDLAETLKNGDKPILEEAQSVSRDEELEEESHHETAAEQEKRIRKQSIFGHLKTWKLLRLIIKSGDDLRQEQFAMQLISQIDQIFKRKKLNIWLKPYEILATGKDCGLIEFLPDATSIDAYKKKNLNKSLEDYFQENFTTRKSLKKARDAFARSLAGYSLVCYILQIKDRHNGNILIDKEGHIMHIDFGFLLTNAPGKGLNFEQAPFKLTDEFVSVMNGLESSHFKKFRQKLIAGFSAIQSKAEHLICLVEMMTVSQSELDCFIGGRERVISELRDRLFPYHGKKLSKAECTEHIDYLISASYNNWRTRVYDGFQKCCQGIAA